MESIKINTEFIKLNQLLKWANIAATGGEANQLIQDGLVRVNDEVELRRGKKIYPGDKVEVENAGSFLVVN